MEGGAQVGAQSGTAALRRPLSAYFIFCGRYMDLGVVGAGGYFVAGGSDTSPASREGFCHKPPCARAYGRTFINLLIKVLRMTCVHGS